MISPEIQRAWAHDIEHCPDTSCLICIGANLGHTFEHTKVILWLRERAEHVGAKADDAQREGDALRAVAAQERADVLSWAATCIERLDHLADES